jgi:hypothetical protein
VIDDFDGLDRRPGGNKRAQAALLANVERAVSGDRGDGCRPIGEAKASLVAGD